MTWPSKSITDQTYDLVTASVWIGATQLHNQAGAVEARIGATPVYLLSDGGTEIVDGMAVLPSWWSSTPSSWSARPRPARPCWPPAHATTRR